MSGTRTALICATFLSTATADAQETVPVAAAMPELETQFRDPPATARPRLWWHWMNGNVTEDGIAKDLAWMKRIGVGGLQMFDVNLETPQIVERRMVYMTPEWKRAFRFAAREADRLGLELAIAASPGWSETGGPWVPPPDGLKKLVWSQTDISGGRRFRGALAAPPRLIGPFQSVPKDGGSAPAATGGPKQPQPFYDDVAVLAFPISGPAEVEPGTVTAADGAPLDARALSDVDLASGVELPKRAGTPPTLQVAYPAARTIRSATLFVAEAAGLFASSPFLPKLEASEDGKVWRPVADLPLGTVPTTVAFAPVTASRYRLVFTTPPTPNGGGFGIGSQAEGVDFAAMAGATAMAGFGAPKGLTVTDFRLSAEDRIDRAEAKAGFSIVPDYHALARRLPEANSVAPAQVIDLTRRMAADGTLDWTPPSGRWRVLRLGYSLLGTTNHPAPPEATGLEVDKFDGAAVRRYLDHYIRMYQDAAGAELVGTRGVRAILTDSIEVGAANWTPRMIAQFKRLRSYDPTAWLPALTGVVIGSRAESDRFLFDYRRTLADLLASEHYGTVAAVAHEHSLKVYGEALEDNRPSLGDDIAMRRHADVPMAALWTFARKEGPRATYLADIKGAASVAHLYGQNLVAAESMTSLMAPWAFGPSDLKRVIDLEFVTGVNRPVVHTSVHVPTDDKKPGLSLYVFGQYFNRHESWAELARPWIDYIARNSLLLQQGHNVADIAYFYGEEGPITALYGARTVPDAPTTVAYDFVNADALHEALTNDGADLVTRGGARYRALYLGGSSRHMTLGTLRRIAALVDGGATVIGPKPSSDPGLAGNAAEYASLTARLWPGSGMAQVGKGRVIASSDIAAALPQAGIAPDFRFTGGKPDSELPFLHRKLADGDSYFVVNRRNRPETGEMRFRVTGRAPELWRAETGTQEAVPYRVEAGETVIPIHLEAEDSVHVVFRKPAIGSAVQGGKPPLVEAARIEGPWRVAFEPNRGAPAEATFAKLTPLNENRDPGIRFFSGVATYRQRFATPRGWARGMPLWLDLGEAREIAEVIVNGRPAGHAWHAPYRVDISAMTMPGSNVLQVRVANLWVNRLIGDAQPGAKKITWTALPTYTAKAPLRRSGLIGPVTLLQSRR